MKKIFTLCVMIALAGCQTNESMYQNGENNATGAMPPSAFAHFTDIPIPDRAAMNLDKTVILGAGEEWTGKLTFTTPFGTNNTFDYYITEMPKLGWKETAIVRADVSFLTYNRKGREAIIQIYGDSSESNVDFLISPERRKR